MGLYTDQFNAYMHTDHKQTSRIAVKELANGTYGDI